MPHFVCVTCGVQHPESAAPPGRCAICMDERQYVGLDGQRWTTLDQLRSTHRAEIREEQPGLLGIGIEPEFAIGQRALLHRGILWDCIPLLDHPIVAAIEAEGGLRAIALSHPHYYSAISEWSLFFDVPVYVHADDERWLQRRDGRIELWEGESLDLGNGVTIIRCGGHFAGACVMHTGDLLLTGDTIQVIPDRSNVSFMYSYPNLIPLDAQAINRIVAAVEPFDFDRIYGAWWGRVIKTDAKAVVSRSAERYIKAIGG